MRLFNQYANLGAYQDDRIFVVMNRETTIFKWDKEEGRIHLEAPTNIHWNHRANLIEQYQTAFDQTPFDVTVKLDDDKETILFSNKNGTITWLLLTHENPILTATIPESIMRLADES